VVLAVTFVPVPFSQSQGASFVPGESASALPLLIGLVLLWRARRG
jgi:uncharacterized protein (TIGR03382 family)